MAGRRLYVQNVGNRNLTVVLQPGPEPSVLWQYATEESSAVAFLDDAQFVRTGATRWCMRGKTPAEPRDPQVGTIEAQPFLEGADLKAPVVQFADRAFWTEYARTRDQLLVLRPKAERQASVFGRHRGRGPRRRLSVPTKKTPCQPPPNCLASRQFIHGRSHGTV